MSVSLMLVSSLVTLMCLLFLSSYYYPLEASLLANERQKGVDVDARRGGEELEEQREVVETIM